MLAAALTVGCANTAELEATANKAAADAAAAGVGDVERGLLAAGAVLLALGLWSRAAAARRTLPTEWKTGNPKKIKS